MNNLSELNSIEIEKIHKAEVKALDHSNEKWTKYSLDTDEIELLRKIKADIRIKSCSDIVEVDAGIVTEEMSSLCLVKSLFQNGN